MGIHIAIIAAKFGLQVDEGLARILPASDDDDSSWVPGFDPAD